LRDKPLRIDPALQLSTAERGRLDGTYIAEFTRVVIPLSIFPAFRCLVGLMFHSTMRSRSVIGRRSTIVCPHCRSVLVQFTKICHHATFLLPRR
jgi:hypothetical protein